MRDDVRIPMIYVSHAVEEVVRLAQHVVLLASGSVAASGSVQDVMGQPDTGPAHAFEGGAVIEGTVVARDLHYELATIEFDGGAFAAPDAHALIGERVRVRVRARDVSIALERPTGISVQNILRGKVTAIEPAPGGIAVVSIKAGAVTLRSRITRRAVEQLALAPGVEVHALVKAVSLDRHGPGYAG
jgi:molybdate transport system ATP-binding protein